MYKLININAKNMTVLEQSKDLVTVFQALDKPEYKYKTPVIVNDDGDIVAGNVSAWEWAKLKEFKV